MSNRSNGPKTNVEVISIFTDLSVPIVRPNTHTYRVDIGSQQHVTKTESPTMNAFLQSNVSQLRIHLSIYFPNSEWKNQYQVGQKYDLSINETGDLVLKKSDKT